jgi:hypothetical protein
MDGYDGWLSEFCTRQFFWSHFERPANNFDGREMSRVALFKAEKGVFAYFGLIGQLTNGDIRP